MVKCIRDILGLPFVMDKEKMKETLNEELSGSIDFDVLDVSEGQIIRLKDGTLIDPEIFISYFNDLSAFEEEFGPLEEAKEKLRDLKKLEEEFGPVSEISEALNKLYEKAEALLESYHDEEEDENEDVYLDDEEDDDEEELDVSDLTVKQLLALLVTALLDDDEGADEDVDLEDLDLEHIGDMTVGELLQLLREGKVEEILTLSEGREDEEVSEGFENKEKKVWRRGGKKVRYPSRSRRLEDSSVEESVERVSEGREKKVCGCGGNKSKSSSSIEEAIEKLFEEGEEGGIAVQPPMGMVEKPNKYMDDEEEEEKEKEVEEEEKGEKEDQENMVKVKEESFTNESASSKDSFDLDIFKRLLDRLG